jgi:ribosomal protein S18 acetylase RimI-like enzyme
MLRAHCAEIASKKSMMEESRRYDTKHGSVTLRRERAGDAPFLLSLFASHAGRALCKAGLPEDAVAKLISFQHRSADATHHAMFPNAAYSIIECDGEPIGRLIEEDEGDTVYYVDFALLPERQMKGLGTAFIEMVSDEWAAAGKAARVEVLVNNEPSLKLCRYCGFAEVERSANGYVQLRREMRGRHSSGA